MMSAQNIFEKAFSPTSTPRSRAFKEGVLDTLKFRLGETKVHPGKKPKYPIGSAEQDAYWSGCDEGHHLAREFLSAAREIGGSL